MQSTVFSTEKFTELSPADILQIGGGAGFAYDAGRFIRFIVISNGYGDSMAGAYAAVLDFIACQV